MSLTIPQNFVDINFALSHPNEEFDIIGIVTDFLAPVHSRGTDWMCSFSITDSSYGGTSDDGFKVRFFRPVQSELPAIHGIGDVISLRGIKVKEWSGMTLGLSTRGTSWVVFPAASIPVKLPASNIQLKSVRGPRARDPSVSEMQYAISLCNSRDRSTFTEPASQSSSSAIAPSPNGGLSVTQPRREKFSLIKDVQVETYYDLVGQVVRVYPNNGRVELYITDYTSNKLLYNYEWGQDDSDGCGRDGDVYNYAPRKTTNRKWPGPLGKRTLTVTLWPPHSYFGQQNLKENDFVHLRNVHMKWSKDSKIEGVLHSDRKYPDRIDVTALRDNDKDDRVKDLLRRKRDLSKQFLTQRDELIAQARGQKRKEMEDAKPLSKTAVKKKKKLERERLKTNNAQDMGQFENNKNQVVAKDCLEDDHILPKALKRELNSNVHCSNHLITPRSLSLILSFDHHNNSTPSGTSYTLPFQNIKSRAVVRIINFFPSDLADFAVPCRKSSEYDILSDPEDSESESPRKSSSDDAGSEIEEGRRWEWRFGFVLEDALGPKNEAKASMEVFVAEQDAEFLLKLDAEDLRKSPKALATLREKLFLLWGDLEEQKTRYSSALKEIDENTCSPKKVQAFKSRPFQCCLKEYGVKKIEQTVSEAKGDSGNEGEGESEIHSRQKGTMLKSLWTWERRWRMFGCTII